MRIEHPHRAPYALGAGAPLLELMNLRVSYGGIRAVRGVALKVAPREIVTLIGANGAGKSSTLRAVAHVVPISGGIIKLAGESTAGLSVEDMVARGVTLVPEGRGIFADLTVGENLRAGAYSHRDARTIEETMEDVVALFPRLGERRTQRAGTLSGGEQQMLAIGRALMARPALLLLDEPSLGLAPRLVRTIFDAITRIADSGVAVLLVEQNTRLALAVSHRAYVLRGGEVAIEGNAWDVAQSADVQAAYLGG